ncbi:MAG: hypothetical protein MHMPM18_005062 [Marteilia pararefringens]
MRGFFSDLIESLIADTIELKQPWQPLIYGIIFSILYFYIFAFVLFLKESASVANEFCAYLDNWIWNSKIFLRLRKWFRDDSEKTTNDPRQILTASEYVSMVPSGNDDFPRSVMLHS